MNRIALCATALASSIAVAEPKIGDTLTVTGDVGWAAPQWLYDTPNPKDAAGKVVIHWFCAPKLTGCTEDLARVMTLKEALTNVYIVAYIDGTKAQAKKLDPIRGSEGVGRGTVAFGPNVGKLHRSLGINGPYSIVVDTDNKVTHITTGSAIPDLDKRDASVKGLVSTIRTHSVTATGPAKVKPNEKFELVLTVKLSPWLVFSTRPGTPYAFTARVPKDIKCDRTALKGDQLKPTGSELVVKMTCSGPRGVYEATSTIQFGYDTPSGASGLGADGGRWKFSILP